MKKITLVTVLLLALSVSMMAQQATTTIQNKENKLSKKDGPVAKFEQTVIDLGQINQGIPRTAEFILTNDGNQPLLISAARASCGCTNLKYGQEPILPNKSTTISATYNAAAPGPFIKTVSVTTNADVNPVVLQIKGTVIKKEEPAPETK
ncbi:MAG: DUF1573 domain-containing protein [Bacteroidetes bacterium]|nr:MAG: DUF1573 domain-containing protein [Bacteroidota bacterium]